ncbi:MAG: sugar ABC transporter ATP-binding protein [Bifidobacteriaceae bacterium]|nr:sugar ABC transporter ATP-binding protein [Bifidobacteriaceae bacterium]
MAFIEISGISKSFGATKALSDVSMTLDGGEIHGLLGENGAGKSTLMKIMSGVVLPDAGRIAVEGRSLPPGKPAQARRAGIGIAYQELSSPPNITVGTKLLWPKLPRGRSGLVSRKAVMAQASGILERFNAPEIDPAACIGQVSLAQRQKVEIVTALAGEPKLLVLDEPTAALPDTEWLFGLLRGFSAAGGTVVYITHKMPEIDRICHRGTILRNGRIVGSFERGSHTDAQLVELMIGRSVDHDPDRRAAPRVDDGRPMLEVKGLMTSNGLVDGTLTVGRGEIVGIAGLEGQGQRDLLYAIAGAHPRTGGEIRLEAGTAATLVALLPEERKTEALLPRQTATFNMTIGSLRRITRAGIVSASKEARHARRWAAEVNLPQAMLAKPIEALSGGNQQKAVIGRALARDPACLVLFDPTRGVDPGTKFEIYDFIRDFAAKGRAVLLYSTEIPELVRLCHRVYAISAGRVGRQFAGPELSEQAIMSAALAWGGEQP